MRPASYPPPIQALLQQLKRLPGIGPRGAERLTLHLLAPPAELALSLAQALQSVVNEVRTCRQCGFFCTGHALCDICSDSERDPSLLCVVEHPADVLRLDRTGAFPGRYHVLGGRLSPLDNIHPEDLRIASLLERAKDPAVTEVILAVGADVEGEATAHYLHEALTQLRPLTVTRLAQGLPAGGSLDHTDEITLHRALRDRRAF